MARWWKEVWAAGEGESRTYCGIARTIDGYAVDVFRGDSCIASEIHGTREQAERAASELGRRHVPHRRSASMSQSRDPRESRPSV